MGSVGLLGALPARFRRTRVLVVGCGDVGLRLLRAQQAPVRWLALTSTPARADALRLAGAVPLLGNLDDPATLRRLAGIAQRVVHLAPPLQAGTQDTRTQALLRTLALRGRPVQMVYGSTTGVYGDCQGQWVTEQRPTQALTARAIRRVSAEQQLRQWGRALGVGVSVLRIPGIYAHNRDGGPAERLSRGTPALHRQDDAYTNHIHADDLARACMVALWRGPTQRMVNICDDTDLKSGDYLDLAADLLGVARPPRVSRVQAEQLLSPMVMSFMSESRRIDNQRMKRELRMQLRYPSVREGMSCYAAAVLLATTQ